MGLIANLRGPAGLPGSTGPMPFVSLAGQVDTTGVSDASSVVQSAVNGLPTYGGAIWLPAGQIKFGGITYGFKAVELVGQGGPGSADALGHGSTEILVPDGQIGVTFGQPSTFVARGPIFRNLRFRGVGTSPAPLGAILINGGIQMGMIDTCAISEAFSTFGVRILGGTAKQTAYFTLRDCSVSAKLGLDIQFATGVQVRGGIFDGGVAGRLGLVVPGSTGIKADVHSDTLQVTATRMQGYETHIDCSAGNSSVIGTRHELFTTGIKIAADRVQLMPASMANSSSLTGTGTAIYLVSGTKAYVNAQAVVAVATRVNYGAATGYVVLDNSTFHYGP